VRVLNGLLRGRVGMLRSEGPRQDEDLGYLCICMGNPMIKTLVTLCSIPHSHTAIPIPATFLSPKPS
jgi:hypothetical protein